MKINKIVLYNFSSFEGVNEFDLTTTDQEHNIILIGGKNGAGKTSLFTAIKIALYGPLAFGYIGINPHYTSKIKEYINSKSFQKNKVESMVQITISLMVEREIRKYEITRSWDYSKQKLEEDYYVKQDGVLLDDKELSYFQNFLLGVIPPDLFDFFLFDGEEIGTIFSNNNYNTYVKNAVYTLCGLDTFEIIRKYTGNYSGKAVTEDEEKLNNEYEKQRHNVEELEQQRGKIQLDIIHLHDELEELETKLLELETEFKNAGGIPASEKKIIFQKLSEAERAKTESSTKIKLFVEGLMPFFIVRDFADEIQKQLDIEERQEIYQYLDKILDVNEIKKIMPKNVSDDNVKLLMNLLLSKVMPDNIEKNGVSFGLSKEETQRVNGMISSVRDFNVNEMIKIVNGKQEEVEKIAEMNHILKNAISEEDEVKFTQNQNLLLETKAKYTEELHNKEKILADINGRLVINEQKKEQAWQKLKANAQNKHVFELSSGLSVIMDTLLKDKMKEIRSCLEKLIIKNLQNIYRKNNLITHIEIDEKFQFHLYQNAVYETEELIYLIKNIGKNNFEQTIGRHGKYILFEKYHVETIKQLQHVLSYASPESIDLYKNIELNRLSKGERQIFILALYWAIIQVSGQEIPFIIDTPYARIDASHRREISEKFFPNISKQVVILSTDEEINEEYYAIIKSHIAREYLLINDENQNRTSIKEGYFFGV